MKLLTKSRKRAARNMYVWVTNHYMPTLYGIRGKYEVFYKSGQYLELGRPGTGFFIRSSSSHAYRDFCKKTRESMVPTYMDFVMGREFDHRKEMDRAEKALQQTKDELKATILESYLNVLPLSLEAMDAEKVVAAIKDLAHKRKKTSKYQREVMSSYKSNIGRLGHSVRELQMSTDMMCSKEQYGRFGVAVKSFSELCSSRRIWHSREVSVKNLKNTFKQVYFDMGIFNFIQAPLMTPMMRDSQGSTYWLYPKYLVASRDSVDFDVYPLTDLTFMYRSVPYDNISSMILDSYADLNMDGESGGSGHHHHHRNYDDVGEGLLVTKENEGLNEDPETEVSYRERVIGELYIPELKLRYYVRDTRLLKHFVNDLNDYIKEGIN